MGSDLLWHYFHSAMSHPKYIRRKWDRMLNPIYFYYTPAVKYDSRADACSHLYYCVWAEWGWIKMLAGSNFDLRRGRESQEPTYGNDDITSHAPPNRDRK